MNKTKIIIIVAAIIVAAALIVLGVKFAGKPDEAGTTEAVTTTDVQTPTTIPTNIEIGDYTTLKPFIDAQTEIFAPTTAGQTATSPDTSATSNSGANSSTPTDTATTSPSDKFDEHATQLDSANGWKDNELTNGLPKINASGISTSNFVTDKGYRTVIRIQKLDYSSYLTYIDRLEDAGFADNNKRAHIPATAPAKVAMFYSKFDGERSFGVYWHGNESSATFDCEIVICDYDQAK